MSAAVQRGFSNCIDGMLDRIDRGQYVPVVTDVSAAAKVILGSVLFCVGGVAYLVGGPKALGAPWSPMAIELIGGGQDLVKKNVLQAIPSALVAIGGLRWMYSR